MPRFMVHVDDPDMDGPHDFAVRCSWESEVVACRAGARRAVLLEGAVRTPSGGRPGLLRRVRQAFNRRLVTAVADYTVLR